jgi:hypothetical protein
LLETVNPSALELSPEARELTALGLAPLPVESRRLDSILDPEKPVRGSQVLLDGHFGQEKQLGYLRVGGALGDEPQDL